MTPGFVSAPTQRRIRDPWSERYERLVMAWKEVEALHGPVKLFATGPAFCRHCTTLSGAERPVEWPCLTLRVYRAAIEVRRET